MGSAHSRDKWIGAIAARQFGVFTRDQALRLGYSPGGIARRLRQGVWGRVHRNVYRLQGAPESLNQHYLAATMFGGPDALLSGEAAGHKWGLAACRPVRPLIVVSRKLADPGISFIRVPEALPAGDRTVVDTIPVTTPTRTLVDLAATVSPGRLQHAFDSAIHRHLTTPDRIALRLEQLGRRGSARRGAPAEGGGRGAPQTSSPQWSREDVSVVTRNGRLSRADPPVPSRHRMGTSSAHRLRLSRTANRHRDGRL